MQLRSNARAVTVCLFALLLSSATLSGCNIVGPAVYFIHGPAKVKPQFELPPDRPAVVFVDDRSNILPSRAVRSRVAKSAEQTLLKGKAVAKSEIISSDALLPIATQERFGKPTGIAQAGELVGAEVVVYAKVESFRLSPDGQQFAPIATASVKVVDAKARNRLWPTAESGEWQTVEASIPTRTGALPRTISERSLAENELADILGRNIARLFVEYEAEEVSQRVGGEG
ncbi:MAG: hypothetical protein ACK4WH_01880 [Phycisphaerales bacterium]